MTLEGVESVLGRFDLGLGRPDAVVIRQQIRNLLQATPAAHDVEVNVLELIECLGLAHDPNSFTGVRR
jgi:hypothetical protein